MELDLVNTYIPNGEEMWDVVDASFISYLNSTVAIDENAWYQYIANSEMAINKPADVHDNGMPVRIL
jgi:hypothetical protein